MREGDSSAAPNPHLGVEALHRQSVPNKDHSSISADLNSGDVFYKDHVIPKGTVILGNTWAIHYDASRYPDPTAFQPERYINHDKYAAEYAAMADPLQRDHYAFGAGRRICPGSRLAENTLNLAVANLLWCFHIRPPGGAEEMDLSDDAWEETAFRPPKPFKVRLTPRSPQCLQVLNTAWMKAKEEGYVIRGMQIKEDGDLNDKSTSHVT